MVQDGNVVSDNVKPDDPQPPPEQLQPLFPPGETELETRGRNLNDVRTK
jgi:hypothetical protein